MSRPCKGCFGSACGACGWTGVVEERIPAADAMADAETLRSLLMLEASDHPRWLAHDLGLPWDADALAHRTAVPEAWWVGFTAAKDAFFLCPGLRGDA